MGLQNIRKANKILMSNILYIFSTYKNFKNDTILPEFVIFHLSAPDRLSSGPDENYSDAETVDVEIVFTELEKIFWILQDHYS